MCDLKVNKKVNARRTYWLLKWGEVWNNTNIAMWQVISRKEIGFIIKLFVIPSETHNEHSTSKRMVINKISAYKSLRFPLKRGIQLSEKWGFYLRRNTHTKVPRYEHLTYLLNFVSLALLKRNLTNLCRSPGNVFKLLQNQNILIKIKKNKNLHIWFLMACTLYKMLWKFLLCGTLIRIKVTVQVLC